VSERDTTSKTQTQTPSSKHGYGGGGGKRPFLRVCFRMIVHGFLGPRKMIMIMIIRKLKTSFKAYLSLLSVMSKHQTFVSRKAGKVTGCVRGKRGGKEKGRGGASNRVGFLSNDYVRCFFFRDIPFPFDIFVFSFFP